MELKATDVEWFREQDKALSHVLHEYKKNRHLISTWQDLDVLESMNKALSPSMKFTDAISGERYVSVSYLKPVLHLLNKQVPKSQSLKR